MSRSRPLRATAALAAGALAASASVLLGLAGPVEADKGHSARPVGTFTYVIDPVGPAADDVFPEGIAVAGRKFFVGSTTDGTIYRGRLGGRRATPFLAGGQDGRTSAIGLKADDGLLFVAGGATGRFFIYDIDSRSLVGSFAVPNTGAGTFLNDAVVARDGSVYITDSLRPALYRIGPRDYETSGVETLPIFRDFTGSELVYTGGFNVNGIAATRDGKHLILAKSNSADFYRVRVSDKQVRRVDLDGEEVSGDGLVLRGDTLYAVERDGDTGFVVKIRVSDNLLSGRVISRTTDPTFNDPTTAAAARGRLLVVNSQFGERAAGVPPGPFTVSSIKRP